MVKTATATVERRERREGETVVAFEKVQLAFDEKVVLNAAKSILPNVRRRNAGVREIAEAVGALE